MYLSTFLILKAIMLAPVLGTTFLTLTCMFVKLILSLSQTLIRDAQIGTQ